MWKFPMLKRRTDWKSVSAIIGGGRGGRGRGRGDMEEVIAGG
jgi:hypothetical protein